MKIFFLFSTIILILASCSNKTIKITDEFIENVPYPKSTEIIYEENFENGEIILYKDETGFRIAFRSDKTGDWTHSSNAELKPKDEFDWTMNNDPTIPIAMFAGVITTEEIIKVIVKQRTLENEAKIIETEEGLRFWFTSFDTLEESHSGEPDPLKIEAFDSNGNLLWKDEVL
ncbi:hypothetical protein [Solibacillus daqui]|uniref:hypothetical protein n=1 Tax=Solibacillus daqui TaxID=2912187 RepID=UPI002366B929|nr:hypothetical protein [Solibacillus daqui]